MQQSGWHLLVKRVLDRSAAIAGLAITSPLLAATALAVRVSMGSPVMFRQERTGHRGRSFIVYKFRTMRAALGPDGQPLPDDERLTAVGRFLRSTSLDELPQLLNVVRGELSLVGPRPLLPQYLPRYSPEQSRRHDVLPGITGWAQVNGRNSLTWSEKFRSDVWYVDHWSLWLDLRILAMTVSQVLGRSGISQAGQATMQEFMGDP